MPSDRAACVQAVTESVTQVVQPWLYFNIVLRNSQIFLPVLDLVRPPCAGWGAHTALGLPAHSSS